jgi:hypothetical protein
MRALSAAVPGSDAGISVTMAHAYDCKAAVQVAVWQIMTVALAVSVVLIHLDAAGTCSARSPVS